MNKSRTLPGMILGLSLALALTPPPTARAATATVNINGGTVLGTLAPHAFGMNEPVWIPCLLDPNLPPKLSALRVGPMRWPGGSTSDTYHWQTNSITPGQGGYADPNNTFDNFMGVQQASGTAGVMITVNYGSNAAGTAGGDPAEAAGWVEYANVTKHYGVKYWEVGNEVYGNGEYGSAWECDLHADHSPTTYGQQVVAYINAMKAKDPTIKIGAVLATPGDFPDGSAPDWNSNVLAQCGSVIDAAIIHWYPQGRNTSDSGLLSSTSAIAGKMATVKQLINNYCGANAPNVQIWLTETNSKSFSPGAQTLSIVNSLFCADDYMTWLENGVTNVDWWDLHNGPNGTTSNYGDYGILSTGQTPEPVAQTPTKSYYGVQMLKYLATPGDNLVSSTSSSTLVAAHAVKQANGNVALLLINKDPSNTYDVTVSCGGFTPASSATVYSYTNSTSTIQTSTRTGVGLSFVQSCPPYSLTTVVMTPGTPVIPPAPTGLTVVGAANQLVKLQWTSSAGATSYTVKRSTVSGSGYANVGTTSANIYSDTTVTNGVTYYYVVSASNSAGSSGNSNQVSAVPNPIAPPTNATNSPGPGRITIMWTQSTTPGVTGNNVYRSSTSGGPYSLLKTLGPSTSYTASAPSGVVYYYVITALTAGGESAYSNQTAGAAR
jgi:hypothetical protein